jgi:hypothetical protein
MVVQNWYKHENQTVSIHFPICEKFLYYENDIDSYSRTPCVDQGLPSFNSAVPPYNARWVYRVTDAMYETLCDGVKGYSGVNNAVPPDFSDGGCVIDGMR